MYLTASVVYSTRALELLVDQSGAIATGMVPERQTNFPFTFAA